MIRFTFSFAQKINRVYILSMSFWTINHSDRTSLVRHGKCDLNSSPFTPTFIYSQCALQNCPSASFCSVHLFYIGPNLIPASVPLTADNCWINHAQHWRQWNGTCISWTENSKCFVMFFSWIAAANFTCLCKWPYKLIRLLDRNQFSQLQQQIHSSRSLALLCDYARSHYTGDL